MINIIPGIYEIITVQRSWLCWMSIKIPWIVCVDQNEVLKSSLFLFLVKTQFDLYVILIYEFMIEHTSGIIPSKLTWIILIGLVHKKLQQKPCQKYGAKIFRFTIGIMGFPHGKSNKHQDCLVQISNLNHFKNRVEHISFNFNLTDIFHK